LYNEEKAKYLQAKGTHPMAAALANGSQAARLAILIV